MKKKSAFWTGAAGFAFACLVGVTNVNATLLVDRGLPTTNLNSSAGTNRSNVAWVSGADTGADNSADYWMVGDTFTNTASQAWAINKIRLWTVGKSDTTALWGGIDESTIDLVSSSGAISNATYADSSMYQGSSGGYGMHQIDFAVSILLAPGQTYDFFLNGTGGDYGIPFVHASNATLSGSPQEGADNAMLWGEVVSGSFNQTSVQPWTSLGGGWDKASDVNVQAFGTTVPEPSTYAMLILGLGLLGFVGRRKKETV